MSKYFNSHIITKFTENEKQTTINTNEKKSSNQDKSTCAPNSRKRKNPQMKDTKEYLILKI